MASTGSSSESGSTVEERLDTLEHAMDRIKIQAGNQDQRLQETTVAGEKSWNRLNEDLRKLRADHSASSENLQEFKDETHTSFKDVANLHGDFGNLLSALEKAVSKLIAKLDK